MNEYRGRLFSMSAGDFSAVAVRTVAYFTDAPLKTSSDRAVYAVRARRDKPDIIINEAVYIARARIVFEYYTSRFTYRHRALAVYTASMIYNGSVPDASRQR